MKTANALTDQRGMISVRSSSRRRCHCGCGTRATHIGTADRVAMMSGCELSVRRWMRSPIDAIKTAIRLRTHLKENSNG